MRRSRPSVRTAATLVGALVVILVVGTGCGDGRPADAPGDAAVQTVTVSAAASLTEAFEHIARGFRSEHPEVDLRLNFDSSSTLVSQVLAGAPADVIATADEQTMAQLTDAGRTRATPTVFARNRMVIVTRPGNPEGIHGLADLATLDVVALCGARVPCGRFAATALDAAHVRLDERHVTRGQNAKATLTAVAQGDADAGVVYATDASSAGPSEDTLPNADDVDPVAAYPIAVLRQSKVHRAADAFVRYVLGGAGQAVLARVGFRPPT
jgi:molybdate transport system substrate-binding protein